MRRLNHLEVLKLGCICQWGESYTKNCALVNITKIFTRDIDLVLVSREVAFHDKRRVLQLLASVMKRAEITNHVTIIAKARVPIIKFVTRIGRSIIRFNALLYTKNRKTVCRYQYQPREWHYCWNSSEPMSRRISCSA